MNVPAGPRTAEQEWEETMKVRMIILTLAAALALAAPAAAQKQYSPGVSDTEIKIGNTNPYSGPASPYGTVGRTQAAYFNMINEQGGVNGRKIDFLTLDDGYSPPKTVEQVRRLVESDQVLLLFANVGTATNLAIHKYLNLKKVPQFFVGSGFSKWNDPKNFSWTIGWWPSYYIEGGIFGRYVLDNVPNPKVAVLYQDDDSGKEYVAGIKHAFGDKAKSIVVSEASYESTDPTVDSQVIQLAGSGANVFFNGGTPKFIAQAIRKAHDLGWKPVQLLPSTSSSVKSTLEPAGLEASIGVITAQYLKDPTDPQWANDADVNAWRAFINKYYPEGSKSDYLNVYAYAVAASLVYVLKQAGDDLTRENIMRQASSLKNVSVPLLLPGIRLNTSPTDFASIKQMQLAKFNGKAWQLFGPLIGAPQ
jgi:branched-chain amino acid transport system substrate-binding protein